MRSRNAFVFVVAAALGIVGAYSFDPGFWIPYATQLTISMVGTLSVTSLGIAIPLAFAYGLTRMLTGTACTMFCLVPSFMQEGLTKRAWAIRIMPFVAGALLVSATLGAVLSIIGANLVPSLVDASGRLSMASFFQALIGVVVLLLAMNELQLLNISKYMPKFSPRNQLLLGSVVGGLSSLGCASPINLILIAWVAVTANPVFGMVVFMSAALGRIFPVMIAGTVGFLGVGPTRVDSWLKSHSSTLRLINGTALSFMAVFILFYWTVFSYRIADLLAKLGLPK